MTLYVENPSDLLLHVGNDLGVTDTVAVNQETVNAFAALTLDDQWIHTDPARAANGPFSTTIAHGFLTLALCSHFMEQLLHVRRARMLVNYGLNRVRFPSPLPVGSSVRASGTLASVDVAPEFAQTVTTLTIQSETAEKPACVAEVVTRFYAEEPS